MDSLSALLNPSDYEKNVRKSNDDRPLGYSQRFSNQEHIQSLLAAESASEDSDDEDEMALLDEITENQDPFSSSTYPILFKVPTILSTILIGLIIFLLIWESINYGPSSDSINGYDEFNGLYECICSNIAANTGNPVDCQTCYYCVLLSNSSTNPTYPSTDCLVQDPTGALPCPAYCAGLNDCIDCVLVDNQTDCGCSEGPSPSPSSSSPSSSPPSPSASPRSSSFSYSSSFSAWSSSLTYSRNSKHPQTASPQEEKGVEESTSKTKRQGTTCCSIFSLDPSLTNDWIFIGPGVMSQIPITAKGMVLIGFGDWGVKQSWVNSWVSEIWKKQFSSTEAFLYSVKGPAQINYTNPFEIDVVSLYESFASLVASNQITEVVIVSHGSGTFVSSKFLDLISNSTDTHSIGAILTYYLLDGLNNQLWSRVVGYAKKIVPVYAYDDSTFTHSTNYQYMKDLENDYPGIQTTKLQMASANCEKYARYCLHNTLINTSPWNSYWNYNQYDYTNFTSSHSLQTSYFQN